MLRLYLCSCAVFMGFGFSEAFIEELVYHDGSPKCCGQKEALLFNNSDYTSCICVPDVNRTSHVLTREVLSNFSCNSAEVISCVDDVVNADPAKRQTVKFEGDGLNVVQLRLDYFPKCCPANSAYDMFGHKCVELTNKTNPDFSTFTQEIFDPYLEEGLLFLNIGISSCVEDSVVVDYELPTYKEISYQKDKGITLKGLKKSFPYGSYCVDKVYGNESYVVRGCHKGFDVCKKSLEDVDKPRCISKCCPDGYYYKGGGQCRFGFIRGLNFLNDSRVRNSEEPFAIKHGHSCGHYKAGQSYEYVLNETGFLNLNLEENKDILSPFMDGYCFEEVDVGTIQGRNLFLCFSNVTNDSFKFKISRITFILSCIFLLLTLIGYTFLPDMQNLHGKTLMCNCGSLFVAFLILVVLQFYPTIEGSACESVGYLAMYTFLAAFMWSNVMCFDIWWTFGSMKIHGVDQRKRECKKFLWYCVYAWTVPMVITSAAFTVQHFRKSIPASMKEFVPTLGVYSCFFDQSSNVYAFLTWFILPIALICICNLVLFIKTVRYCYKVKNEIDKMKDSLLTKNERKKVLTADMERSVMVTKLFLVMGIPWIFESISAAAIPVTAGEPAKIVEMVFDIINSLQGVFIFCVFILKTKFIRALKKKFAGRYFKTPMNNSTSAATTSSYVASSCKV